MATTSAYITYGSYRFNPVPEIGWRSSAAPLGANRSGPALRERIVTITGKIIGTSFNDIQSRLWALDVAFAKQDQTLVWHDGTTQRISATAKVLSIDIPVEWGTYEANYSITLSYLPQDDTNTAPFTVTYGAYTFTPIPVMARQMRVQRESPDSIRLVNRWVITLTGFIDKGSMSANMTEYNALLAALNSDATLTYGDFVQAVKMDSYNVDPDTWQTRINYSISMIYSDNNPSAGVIVLNSSRSISRYTQRNAKHFIPFLSFGQIQLLGEDAQIISAQGFIIGTTLANARSAANTEINAQFPGAPVGGLAIEEPGSRIVERSTDNRVEWNVTKFYTIPALTGGVYGSG